ncbi:MAG: RNA ligase (ATP) [Caldilineaceae bacterium]|nr:RNA ligase (ATP) [Caldilineaceae bacterium]HRJ44497.1 RNA ligase (ATP) [Caldilineaceae bacterium]
MSTIRVEVTTIEDIRPHSNADALELATVGGWQVCVRKGIYQNGDPIVYFEQGTVLPREVAERLNVTQYLKERTDIDGNPVLVIHRVRLRGEPSFGLVVEAEPGVAVGQDVADRYGATKYNPPLKLMAGDSVTGHPQFPLYTDIENMRSYPDVLLPGEEVVITEKIHGTNCRVGFVVEGGERLRMAGSRGLRRKMPESAEAMQQNTYWYPHTLPGVAELLAELERRGHRQAVIFGEVYGRGIQAYTYGQNAVAFRAFDLMVDGKYMDYGEFASLCAEYQIESVPLLYRGEFSLAVAKRFSDGESLVGGAHGREGVVVKPVRERHDLKIGRVILKYVGDGYLFGKVAEQDTTDL